ncbi:MAG: GspH/FimT family protein [Steroidobacteraceae bacterium]
MTPRFPAAFSARGHTLAELVAVLAIAAALAAIAVPSFHHQLAEAGLRTSVQQTQAALHLARQLALGTGSSITVCPSADQQRCSLGAPQWMLFRNGPTGRADRRDGGEPLLRVWQLPARIVVSGSRSYASFLPQIRAAATVTFDFCHAAAPALFRSVVVSQTGRVRVSRQASSTPPRAKCR